MGIIDILYWSFMIGVCLFFGITLIRMLIDFSKDEFFIISKRRMNQIEEQRKINRELAHQLEREREEILNEYKKY